MAIAPLSFLEPHYFPPIGLVSARYLTPDKQQSGTMARAFLPEICIMRTVRVINGRPGGSRPLGERRVIGKHTRTRRRYNRSASTRSAIDRDTSRGQENLADFSPTSITRAIGTFTIGGSRLASSRRTRTRPSECCSRRIEHDGEHDRHGFHNLPRDRPERRSIDPRHLWTGGSLCQVSKSRFL